VQADTQEAIYGLLKAWSEFGMQVSLRARSLITRASGQAADAPFQHFSGFHLSLDTRTAMPRSYLAFYPALYPQNSLKEGVAVLTADGEDAESADAGHPPKYQALSPRENYETASPIDLSSFGPTRKARLGDITLARSGDKGANINL
jgi:hypothetical protein